MSTDEEGRFLPDIRRFRWLMEWVKVWSKSFCIYQLDNDKLELFILEVAPFYHSRPYLHRRSVPKPDVVRNIFFEAHTKKHPDYKTKSEWWNREDFTDEELEEIILLLEPHFHIGTESSPKYLPSLEWVVLQSGYNGE